MTRHAQGRVVRTDARVYHVELEGKVRQFAPRGKLFDELDPGVKNPVVVGDFVRVSLDGDPPGVEGLFPRTNYLPRIASSHDPRAQILFANVDQLFVVGSIAKPTFSSNRTDRILAACEYYEIPAILILNKIDLDEEERRVEIRATYEQAGVGVMETCAIRGELDGLTERLRGKVSVFYGGSGAGKSTILNVVQPGLRLRTGRISRYWDQGRHTTSFSQMYRVEAADGWVIDTPGMRVFRLAGARAVSSPEQGELTR